MTPLSTYILTKNSEKYLKEILMLLDQVADEILIVDSGSTDKTKAICEGFAKVKFVLRKFDNFKAQRNFAAQACTHDMVLFLDSDEVPDKSFIEGLQKLKSKGFECDAYRLQRDWFVFNKPIHCIYPIISPDFPVRLFDRRKASFGESSNLVHETITGYKTVGALEGTVKHYTFHSKQELNEKLELYTDIASQDLIRQKKKLSFSRLFFNPVAAFLKWYIIRGGYKDGMAGLTLAGYAYRYTQKKYKKALLLR